MRRYVAPFILVTMLGGCAPQIATAPPAATTIPPAAWRTSFPMSAQADENWWAAFGDTQLVQLVAQARANNPDVAVAIARVAEARAQEHSARAALLPTLDMSTGLIARQRSLNAFGTASESSVAQPVFQAGYEVDLFGRNRAQIDAARANISATEAARDSAALSVAAATATGYVTLLALDARLAVLRDTLTSRSEALRIARDRASVGYTSQLELRQSEAEYRATEQQIPVIQAAISRQENALSTLTGVPPQSIPRGGQFDALRRPEVPGALPSELTRRRPDIAQAEYALAASDARLRVAQKQFLPQVRLTASLGEIFTSALSDPVNIWSLGGSILAPLFEGGRLQGQFDAATAQRDQAAFAYQRTVLNAFREVEDQLAIITRLDEQERALVAQRAAVADTLRHATNRYRAGYSTYLEQIDAQRALLGVDLSLVQLRNDRMTATIALYQALGGSPVDRIASP